MRVRQNVVEHLHLLIGKSEVFLISRKSCLHGKSHNALLAVICRKNGNTDIVLDTVDRLADTTVLRLSLLGDIHAADDLQTGNDRGKQSDIVGDLLEERTVDAVPDSYLRLESLDMNIGCSLTGSRLDHVSHEHDDRRIACLVDFLLLAGEHLALALLRVRLRRRKGVGVTEVPVDAHHDIGGCCYIRFNLQMCDHLKVVQRVHVHRVNHSYPKGVGVVRRVGERNYHIFTKDRCRDQSEDLVRNVRNRRVHHLHAQLSRERLGDVRFRRKIQLHQDFTESLVARALYFQRLLKLFLRDDTFLKKHVAESFFSTVYLTGHVPFPPDPMQFTTGFVRLACLCLPKSYHF